MDLPEKEAKMPITFLSSRTPLLRLVSLCFIPSNVGEDVAFHSVDAQYSGFSKSKMTQFTIQQLANPLLYCLAVEDHSLEIVHQFVGCEPSGRNPQERILNANGKPHNPCVNAGLMVVISLIKPGWSIDQVNSPFTIQLTRLF